MPFAFILKLLLYKSLVCHDFCHVFGICRSISIPWGDASWRPFSLLDLSYFNMALYTSSISLEMILLLRYFTSFHNFFCCHLTSCPICLACWLVCSLFSKSYRFFFFPSPLFGSKINFDSIHKFMKNPCLLHDDLADVIWLIQVSFFVRTGFFLNTKHRNWHVLLYVTCSGLRGVFFCVHHFFNFGF